MILVIDNYDSFTYNLVRQIRRVATESNVEVYRNDEIAIGEIEALSPDAMVISPGPRRPEHAGVSLELIARFGGSIPILGVCLGHQCIAQACSGRVVQAKSLRHGKTSEVHHNGVGLFAGIPSPMQAMRYHSLAVERDSLPACLSLDAWTDDGEIMALHHADRPLFGIQFHPESFLTPWGDRLLCNFLLDCSWVSSTSPRVSTGR